MKKYKDYLIEKEAEKLKANEVPQYTDNTEVNELRQLVEDMTKWMSIGSFKQKTPAKMLAEFKSTMKRANKVKVQNMSTRQILEAVDDAE
tara:strand:- start:557 stop:826 length:270 start_codon:yes stop_codon:yes gene_type:complete